MVGDAVVLDRILEGVDPVRDSLELGAHSPLGDGHQVGGRGADEVEPVVRDQLLDPFLGHVQRAHHRPEVAERHPRRAVVRKDDLPDVVDVYATPLDLDGRQEQTLLVDLGRVTGESAGRLRPDL